jgi:hypothetical protein
MYAGLLVVIFRVSFSNSEHFNLKRIKLNWCTLSKGFYLVGGVGEAFRIAGEGGRLQFFK